MYIWNTATDEQNWVTVGLKDSHHPPPKQSKRARPPDHWCAWTSSESADPDQSGCMPNPWTGLHFLPVKIHKSLLLQAASEHSGLSPVNPTACQGHWGATKMLNFRHRTWEVSSSPSVLPSYQAGILTRYSSLTDLQPQLATGVGQGLVAARVRRFESTGLIFPPDSPGSTGAAPRAQTKVRERAEPAPEDRACYVGIDICSAKPPFSVTSAWCTWAL